MTSHEAATREVAAVFQSWGKTVDGGLYRKMMMISLHFAVKLNSFLVFIAEKWFSN